MSDLYSLVCAGVLGLVLGLERATRHKNASLRTFALVSLASCLFTILSVEFGDDPTRIAAQIVTGVGFLGSGIVFKDLDKVAGVTTAAMIWVAAGLGMACGFGREGLAISALIVYSGVLIVGKGLHKAVDRIQESNDH